jgi:phage-related protein (TIGR01555 family)
MSDQEADDLFTFNGIANKVISAPANEAVRAGFKLKNGDADLDSNDRIQSLLEDLDGQAAFATALAWDRLYGGCAVLMLIDDGGTLADPVDEGRIRSIEKLEVFDPTDVSFTEGFFYDDPHDPNYGEPSYYTITGYNGGSFYVHESRLLLFKGGIISNRRRRMNNGWGGRVFDQIQQDLVRNDSSLSLSLMLLSRLSQGILKLDGMTSLLQNDFGEEQVQKRLQLIDMARHLMNTIAIDSADEYDQKNLTVSGVKDIMEQFQIALSAATDIPVTVLFGRSPDGQNSTGHSDFENYYNMVERIQQRTLRPRLSRLLYIMGLASDYHLGLPKEYIIKFKELWNPSEKEQAETDNSKAQAKEHEANAAKTYIDMGALDTQEVRSKLDDGDDYDIDISLDKTLSEPAEPMNSLIGDIPGGDGIEGST